MSETSRVTSSEAKKPIRELQQPPDQAERRTKSLNFQSSYTYSHALSAGVNPNYYNPQADYGNSSVDIPNRFVGSVTYSLPFQGLGWYRPAVQGSQLNAILNYSDGIPFSVSAGSNTLYNGATSRANLIPGNGNGFAAAK